MDQETGGSSARAGGESPSAGLLLYHTPPWPEWRDDDVNSEKWDAPPGHVARPSRLRDKAEPVPRWFQDPTGHIMLPADLHADEWKRATSFEFGVPITVCSSDPCDCSLDLITPNHHIIHSYVMRWIISILTSLTCLAELDPFPTEMESPEFIPTGGKTWKPWHHIYSLTRVGKGQTHSPLPNPYGKYVVRLFYLGSWRRITVDDYIPIDCEGRILLPCSTSPGELWPIILTKALLKFAVMIHGHLDEDFETTVITCLTAWLPISLDYKYMATMRKYMWELCQSLIKNNVADNLYKPGDKTEDTQGEANAMSDENNFEKDVFVGKVTILAALSEVTDQSIQGISPCPSHPVIIINRKVIVTGADTGRPETPRWKQLRWKEWAIRTGLIEFVPIVHTKSAAVLSAFRQQGNKEDETRTDHMMPSVLEYEILHVSQESKTLKQNRTTKVSSKNNVATISESKSKSDTDFLAVKESRDRVLSGKKLKSKSKRNQGRKLSDENSIKKFDSAKESTRLPYIWYGIEMLCMYIQTVTIYYRLSTFKCVRKIPGVNIKSPMQVEKAIRKKSRKEHSQSSHNQIIEQSDITANTFYLFSDTISAKWLFISMCILPDVCFQEYASDIDTEMCKENILETGYIVGQKYNWRHDLNHEILFVIDAHYITSAVIQLGEGLQVLKVWAKFPKYFSVIISSETPFVVGSLQQIQELLTYGSTSVSHYAMRISTAFDDITRLASAQDSNKNVFNNFWQSYIPVHLLQDKQCAFDNNLFMFHGAFEHATVNYLFEELNDCGHVDAVLIGLRGLLESPEFGLKIMKNLEKTLETSTNDEPYSRRVSNSNHLSLKIEEHLNLRPHSRFPISSTSPADMSQTTKNKESKNNKLQHLFLNDNHTTGEIIRKMTKLYPDILIHYPFRNDFEKEVSFADYMGEININEGQDWVLFLRFVLNFHQEYKAFTSFTISTPFSRYVYRIINNDSKRDMSKIYSNTVQDMFHHNIMGYTVLAYAKREYLEEKEMTWKLRIMSSINAELIHSCFWKETGQCIPELPPALASLDLRGYYMPNKRAILFRVLLCSNKKQVLSIRVTFSEPDALGRLSITSSDGTVMCITESAGTLIVPVLWVDSSKNSHYPHGDDYTIEVSVLRDSWILTDDEMVAVQILKERSNQDISNKVPGNQKQSRKKYSSPRKNSNVVVGAPSWHLQVIANSNKVEGLSLVHDSRPQEALSTLKRTLEQEEPGRAARALGIRQDFLSRQQDYWSLYSLLENHSEGADVSTQLVENLLVVQEAELKMRAEEWQVQWQMIQDRMAEISWGQASRHQAMKSFTDKLQQRSWALVADKASLLEQYCQIKGNASI